MALVRLSFLKEFQYKSFEKVKDKESSKILGEDLYKLSIIMDIPTFNSALSIFCNKLKRINLSFFNYFHNIFVKNKREWTMAFRWLSRLNTNCFAEGAFSSLKVRFLKKKNNRLEELVIKLEKFTNSIFSVVKKYKQVNNKEFMSYMTKKCWRNIKKLCF